MFSMSNESNLAMRSTAACFVAVFGGMTFAVNANDTTDIDKLYGVAVNASHIKYYEVDPHDNIMLNPYLQVANKQWSAVIDPTKSAYDWCIDEQANLVIIQPVPHPRGRQYSGKFVRPEDGYTKLTGYTEKYGHVSATAGQKARFCGEIVYDKNGERWLVNNKSGRYSKYIDDRTPDKLIYAAKLIRKWVETNGEAWGPTIYLLEYGPRDIMKAALHSLNVYYANPETKKMPYIIL